MTARDGRLPLILVTSAFPYGSGEQFLETEIRHLAAAPFAIRVLPRRISGPARPLPSGVIMDASLARQRGGPLRRARRATRLLGDAVRDLSAPHGRPWQGWPTALKRLAIELDSAVLFETCLGHLIESNSWSHGPCIIYSYWFVGALFGLFRLKQKHPHLKIVARAHGSDLYAEAHDPPYMPLRRRCVAMLDRIYAVSEHGSAYLQERYGAAPDKVQVARLGVDDPGRAAAPSDDGAIRVVSCSALNPLKRLHLLVHGLAYCARAHPETAFHWTHIGDGPLRPEIETLADAVLPPNVSRRFTGLVTNQAVLEYYRQQAVDVFVNVSASEGVPVSIMEAQSFGIPAVATAVGGVPEIVTPKTGRLLPPDPAPEAIAVALWDVAMRRPDRTAIRQQWRQRFCGAINYPAFAASLQALAKES